MGIFKCMYSFKYVASITVNYIYRYNIGLFAGLLKKRSAWDLIWWIFILKSDQYWIQTFILKVLQEKKTHCSDQVVSLDLLKWNLPFCYFLHIFFPFFKI